MGVLDGLFPQGSPAPAPTLDGILAGADGTNAADRMFGWHQATATPTLDRLLAGAGNGSGAPDFGARDDGSTLLRSIKAGGQVYDQSPVEQRGNLLPIAHHADGSVTFDQHPQLAQGAIDAFMLPGQVYRGEVDPYAAENADRIAAASTSMMGGGSIVPKPEGSLGIFGGKLAKTADSVANKWFEGADGKARFEIPDHSASLIAGAPEKGTLLQVLDHPALYEAYPHLAETTYSIGANDSGELGAFNEFRNHIDVAPSDAPSEIKATLLHELQHGVQAHEGFARGGSALLLDGGMDAYRRLMGEVEARNVETRMRMPPELIDAIPPMATESVRRNKQLLTAPSIFDTFFAVQPHID